MRKPPFIPQNQPIEAALTLGTYLENVIYTWVGIMTCGVIAGALALIATGGTFLWTLALVAISFGSLFAICYWVWREERQMFLSIIDNSKDTNAELTEQIESARIQIDNLKLDRRPKLIGEMKRFSAVEWRTENGLKDGLQSPNVWDGKHVGLIFYVDMSFTNANECETTIHKYSLIVTCPEQIFKCFQADPPYVEYDHYKFANKPAPHIYAIIDEGKPAKQGHRIEGELVFKVPNMTLEDFQNLVSVTVNIEDAFRQQHPVISWDFRKKVKAVTS